MAEDRPYWDMEIEPLLNTPEMRELQLKKLRTMLGRMHANAPFFRRMMDDAGLDPEGLSSFGEFREKIPPFDKASLRQLVLDFGGDILKTLDQIIPVSVDDLDFMATTTGTTGIPTPYPLTMHDIFDVWGEAMTRGGWRAGIRKNDRILYCFALSMVIAGIPTMLGLQKIGAMVIPVGAEAKTERILMTNNLFRGTVYVGTPSLAAYLIEQAPKVIGREVGDLGFRILCCGAEPGAGIPEVRANLESAYKARVFDVGAGFGFSCDHQDYQGMHWLGDDLCYYELIDPDTKAPIPLEDGAQGEALFTSLVGDGFVVLRNSLGDIHQVFTDPCPCGRTGFRYRIVGRTDDMLKVKGAVVYPAAIKGVLTEFVPRVTGEMRIILDEKPPRVVPPLKIRVEHGNEVKEEDLPALEKELIAAMSARIKLSPLILWEAPGALERSTYKGQIFEKTYEKN